MTLLQTEINPELQRRQVNAEMRASEENSLKHLAGVTLSFLLGAAHSLLGIEDGARLGVALGRAQRDLAHARPKAQRADGLPIAALLQTCRADTQIHSQVANQDTVLCATKRHAAVSAAGFTGSQRSFLPFLSLCA